MAEPTIVHNKDIPLLASVHSMRQEVQEIEKSQEWTRHRMFTIKARSTGCGIHGNRVPRGLDEAYAALAELDEEYTQAVKSYVRQIRRAQKVITGIESLTMRTFVKMKYISGASNAKIMAGLGMSQRGLSRAKKCVEEAPCMAAVKWHERYILAVDDE